MPYLNGDRTVDASGNGLLDAVSNALQTPPFDFTQIINDVRALAQDFLLSFGPFSTLGGGLRTIVQDLLGTTPARAASTMDYVESIYGFTFPDAAGSSNIPQRIADVQDYLEAQVLLTRLDTSGSHPATVQEVYDALTGQPTVTLPDPAPAGYGGPTVENIWGHYLNDVLGTPVTADEGVSAGWKLANHMRRYGQLPLYQTRDFLVDFSTVFGSTYATGFSGITCDYTDILADDTVLSWLTRTDTSGRVWEVDSTTGLVFSETNLGDEYHTQITCTLTDADLQAIRAGYAQSALTLTNAPPVWPGVANVTLGTPVAFTGSITVTEAMHGVIVTVTTPPQKLSQIVIGDRPYDYRVGEITFESDNGEVEPFQYMGFRSGVFTPRFMAEAAAVHLRVLGGAEGTVTPWTIGA